MSSRDRLRVAMEHGIIPGDSIAAALGNTGLSAADILLVAEADSDAEPIPGTFLEAFSQTQNISKSLYDARLSGNFATPTIEEFAEAGYELDDLTKLYSAMAEKGLQPEVVIAPMLSKSGITQLSESVSNDLQFFHSFAGITNCITDPVRWSSYLYSTACPRMSRAPDIEINSRQLWTLCILPGIQSPEHSNQSYSDLQATHPDQLPSVMQLVALQMQRIQSGRSAIDIDFRRFAGSWASSHTLGDVAPVVSWVASEKKLVIREEPLTTRDPALGTRLARWRLS